MKYQSFRIIALLGCLSVTACSTTDATMMTLGSTGQIQTRVDAWKKSIQVDEVRGAEAGLFSGKAFHKALQQTLVNIGYGATDGQGTLHLKVGVIEAFVARFSQDRGGVLRTHYLLIAEPGNRVLLDEKINTTCTTLPDRVKPTDTGVMEECGRQNISAFLLKLEKKGLETTPPPSKAAGSI